MIKKLISRNKSIISNSNVNEMTNNFDEEPSDVLETVIENLDRNIDDSITKLDDNQFSDSPFDLDEETDETNANDLDEATVADELYTLNDPERKPLLEEFDFNKLRPAASKGSNRSSTEAGVISIINSTNGRRISLSKGLMQKLNCPKTVQFSFFDEGIAIAEDLPNNEISFKIKELKNQFLIYSASLVNEITEVFNLDFTGITSKTFYKVQFSTIKEIPVAMISIK